MAIILHLIPLIFFIQVKFRKEAYRLSVPRGRKFPIFFSTFVVFGLVEAYWLAYPLFVSRVSEILSRMGFILAANGIVISAITFLVNWLSDIKMRRVEFADIGVLLNATWFFLIGFATAPQHIVLLSALSGLASAFTISWFANYGDSFSREYYASILVLREIGLMIGRILNLIPHVSSFKMEISKVISCFSEPSYYWRLHFLHTANTWRIEKVSVFNVNLQ